MVVCCDAEPGIGEGKELRDFALRRPPCGKPLTNQAVVLDLAGFRAAGAQILVAAGNRHNCLSGGLVAAALRKRICQSRDMRTSKVLQNRVYGFAPQKMAALPTAGR